MGTEGLRSGLSIISNAKGEAGLGVKSEVEVGSKKFEISGSLDPNSNSDQGKSADRNRVTDQAPDQRPFSRRRSAPRMTAQNGLRKMR